MRAEEIVSMLHGRGHYPKWRAKCPVHKSKGLTLALKAGKERLHITCHAGCESDDVLATLGLTWRDALYVSGGDSKAIAAARAVRSANEREEESRRKTLREVAAKLRLYEDEAGYYGQEMVLRGRFVEEYHIALMRARFWCDRWNALAGFKHRTEVLQEAQRMSPVGVL